MLSRSGSWIATVIGAGVQGREHLRLLPLIRNIVVPMNYRRGAIFAPQGRCAHNDEADGPPDPGNELLPSLVIARCGAETDDVL